MRTQKIIVFNEDEIWMHNEVVGRLNLEFGPYVKNLMKEDLTKRKSSKQLADDIKNMKKEIKDLEAQCKQAKANENQEKLNIIEDIRGKYNSLSPDSMHKYLMLKHKEYCLYDKITFKEFVKKLNLSRSII